MCGLIPDKGGLWKLEQLTTEMRNIVESKIAYFHGQDPSTYSNTKQMNKISLNNILYSVVYGFNNHEFIIEVESPLLIDFEEFHY